MQSLENYRKKRNFDKTPEPRGRKEKTKKHLRFCVQHHIAQKDHYDLRLEWNGVLKSFAIPKGPSYNPKEKRLAIEVEDHPYAYRNFEGIIPKGEYGAGTVMLWDEGYWEPLENLKTWKRKPIKFSLYGTRLQGMWTLLPFQDNWLLIKEKDGVCLFQDVRKVNTSIQTNRTMEEIRLQQGNLPLELTSPKKVMDTCTKATKEELFHYYEKVSKRMFPYIKGRMISTVRCPNGVQGTSFFKKHFENKRHLLKRIGIKNKLGKMENYYSLQHLEGILEEVQMNGVEFHMGCSSEPFLNQPNLLVFDLDPDEGMKIEQVREGVRDVKRILDEFHLSSYLKTSGGKGYHIFVPFACKSWKMQKRIAQDIALLMEMRWPDRYVTTMSKKRRKNKIFIDWFRNGKGASIVAPYSLRARDGLTVSMPIKWSELDKVKPDEITMEEAIRRLKRKDPWENIMSE